MEHFLGRRGITLADREHISYPELPPHADFLTRYLHIEMWTSFRNGHDFAAIVSACALLEFAVKDAAFLAHHLERDKRFDRELFDKIDGMAFHSIVQYARGNGVITEEQEDRYLAFKEDVRNVWMHGSTPQRADDVEFTEVIKANYTTGEVEKVTLRPSDDPMFLRLARIAADREMAPRIVEFVDAEVRGLIETSNKRHHEWCKRNDIAPLTPEQLQQVQESVAAKFGEDALANKSWIGDLGPHSLEEKESGD